MITTSTPLEHTEEGRAFLQRRVAKFGLIGAALGGFFLAIRPLFALPDHVLKECTHPSFLFHFLGAASLGAIWLACRGAPRSPRFMRTVEAGGLFVSAAAYSAMATSLSAAARADYIILLALGLGLIARSIYVPSTAKRTTLLGAVVAIPALITDYWIVLNLDVEVWSKIYPGLTEENLHTAAFMGAVFHAAWWVCIIFTCAAASRVIYGLRKQVRDVRKLGQYTLESKLGEGGMGTVYCASHAMLRRPTAVKLIHADKVGEQSLARFEREVQLTASLTHPNTVTVFDYGRTPDNVFYYAMEHLDGPTLAEVVEFNGPQPVARVAHILDQVAGALAEAHEVGLIHRDIKPANIMLVEQGGEHDVAKVLDFGLVKEIDTGPGDVGLTRDQTLMGTPLFMSPEAIKAPDTVDARSDLYALGAVGYFLVTGTPVFQGDSVVEVCSQHLHTPPEPPSERLSKEIPADFEEILLACLEKDPAKRPQTARELKARLRACHACQGWSEAEASEWWQTCGCDLKPRSGAETNAASARTLDVDFAHRQQAGQRD